MERELFINAVQMVEIDGSTSVPTVVLYQPKGTASIGYQALQNAGAVHEVNEDFKVDLGNFDATSAKRRLFPIATGFMKSAGEITGDFLNELTKNTRSWLSTNGYTNVTRVLVAEPLAMQPGLVSPDWLSNYRQNLKRILVGKGFTEIEFLPEPFGVFQYYRYGIKHPNRPSRRRGGDLDASL